MRTRPPVLDSRQPFRRAEALATGITIRELTGPKFQKVLHGVYVAAGVQLTDLVRARAALHISPDGSYASHHTAARIWGGTAPNDARTHVSVPDPGSRSERQGIASHRATVDADVRSWRSTPVSSPPQCFCEIASLGAGLVELVVLGDSLVRAGVVTPTELIAAADAWTHRGSAVASRAARLVREGVDSPMETRLRLLIVLAGLPEPVVNFVIRHENGDWRLRFDLCYPELKLLIEYDGDQHVFDSMQRARDLERREELQRIGWRIVTIQKQHYYAQPARVLERIRQARLDCGASASSCRVRTTWMNHHT
ncbi:DUF559 domain-containing protein [Microlunatus endophyticus]|nr:DUF559 domain-containing protein [Microlunatus endophyticus]